jgi:AraC-like DNA-binding protein
MVMININTETAVPMIVGVGSTILALLLMLIKIPHSDYSAKLTNSKIAIVVSFLICGFMMFYAMNQYGKPDIRDWDMFLMLAIYIVVHFSTSIISYSMIALLKSEKHKGQVFFVPGLFVSAVIAFMLLESYKSGNAMYFWSVCTVAVVAFLIQSVTYIVHFDRVYKKSISELEGYYDEDESHKIKWVRFCYVISMLTILFVLVYMLLYWFLDYKVEVASIYTIWYLIYMLYLTSNFISFIGSHKLVLDAFAHRALSGSDLMQLINENKKRKGRKVAVDSLPASIKESEFQKLEAALEQWVNERRYCEYDKSREQIARELNTTKEILHHYFTSRKGMDFKTWRTELRIGEAKRLLLKDKKASTNIIADASGFSDRSNFHRQFVKIVGCSPKQWRDSDGNPELI